MNFQTLIAGSAIGGVVIAFWSQIVAVFDRIRSCVIVEVTIDNYLIRQAVVFYCWKHLKRVKLGGDFAVGAAERFILSNRRWRIVPYENIGASSVVFFKGIRPIFMSYTTQKGGNTSSEALRFYYFRWFFNLDKLITEAVKYYEAQKDKGLAASRFEVIKVFGALHAKSDMQQRASAPTTKGAAPIIDFADKRLIGYNLDDINSQEDYQGHNPFDILALPKDIMKVIADAKRWKEHRSWYMSHSIPWKTGWLLYGKPGTGKTSLVKALGFELDMPVHVFSLATFDNPSFNEEWQKVREQTPCIVLFEDIDTVFKGRDNVNKNIEGTALTFDTLLNCIDGIEDSNGIFTIITTNRPEHLDEALGKIDENGNPVLRPGRIDCMIHMTALDEDCRRRIAQRILSDVPDLIEEVVKAGEGEVGATFQKRCTDLAHTAFKDRRINKRDKEYNEGNYNRQEEDEFADCCGRHGMSLEQIDTLDGVEKTKDGLIFNRFDTNTKHPTWFASNEERHQESLHNVDRAVDKKAQKALSDDVRRNVNPQNYDVQKEEFYD